VSAIITTLALREIDEFWSGHHRRSSSEKFHAFYALSSVQREILKSIVDSTKTILIILSHGGEAGSFGSYKAGSWLPEHSYILRHYNVELILLTCVSSYLNLGSFLSDSPEPSTAINIFGLGYDNTVTVGVLARTLLFSDAYESNHMPRSALDFYNKYEESRINSSILISLLSFFDRIIEGDSQWIMWLKNNFHLLSTLNNNLIGDLTTVNIPWYFEGQTGKIALSEHDQYAMTIEEPMSIECLEIRSIVANKFIYNILVAAISYQLAAVLEQNSFINHHAPLKWVSYPIRFSLDLLFWNSLLNVVLTYTNMFLQI